MVEDATPKRPDDALADTALEATSLEDTAVTERSLASTIDPGPRALVIAVAVLVLAGAFALPLSPGANGWEILASSAAAVDDTITLPSRIFVIMAASFGIVLSILSLVTRMWPVALLTAAGCTVSIVVGLLAIWSRQTIDPAAGNPGIGIGLPLAWVAVMVLAFNWVTIASRRSAAMYEAEHARRVAAAEAPDGFNYRLAPPIGRRTGPVDTPADHGSADGGDSTDR